MTGEINTPKETPPNAPSRQEPLNISFIVLPDGRLSCSTNMDYLTFCSVMLDGWRTIMNGMLQQAAKPPSIIIPQMDVSKIKLAH